MMNEYNDHIEARDELFSIYSDAHKDAYGFRPRGEHTFLELQAMSRDEIQREFDMLSAHMEQEVEMEREMEREAAIRLRSTAASLAQEQCISLADAYRWLMQAEGCEGDLEHFLWRMGLGCGTLAFDIAKELQLLGVR